MSGVRWEQGGGGESGGGESGGGGQQGGGGPEGGGGNGGGGMGGDEQGGGASSSWLSSCADPKRRRPTGRLRCVRERLAGARRARRRHGRLGCHIRPGEGRGRAIPAVRVPRRPLRDRDT